jgi:O-antigen ligase
MVALATPLLAVVLAQTLRGAWNGTEFEKAARLGLGLPLILGLMLAIDPRMLRQTCWGMMLAGWVATAKVLWLTYPDFIPPETQEYNAVSYGNLMLLMAAFTVYTLGWQLSRYVQAEKIFKWVTVCVIFFGFILTQIRTGWMALPLFILLAIALSRPVMRRPWQAVRLFLVALLLVALAGMASPLLRERVQRGLQEARECQQVNPIANTSICIRMQLWRAAWDMFRQNPWVGNGSERLFNTALRERVNQGLVSPYVAEEFGEPHNDMMAVLSGYGLPGGLALLLVYFAPAWLFLRRMTGPHPHEQRVAAAMGLAVCVGFAIFGLTEFMFRGMRTMGAYTVLLALFMALSDPSERLQPKRVTPS